MEITFCGAASEVTGSNFLLKTDKYQILVDCGFFQGGHFAEDQNYKPWPFNPKDIDVLLLTHAHLDHCGRIPKLWRDGFRGKIFTTPATRDLAELIMTDAADIMLYESKEDRQRDPLYLLVDVSNSLSLFRPIEYHQKTTILPGVTIELFDAGHILGAASILIEADGKRVVFSGDIGNHPVPIVRDPETPPAADVVIMESTYGGRLHESPLDRRVKLRSVIRRTIAKQGNVIIPAFALERTQEILYELNQLAEEATIPPVPVFLDSPLASAATRVYYNYTQYFDDEALLRHKNGQDIFNFPMLKITESADQSKAIKEVKGSKIIVAGSGMMEGGRVVHHAADYLGDAAHTLLIVGYQGAGTLGRQLYDGHRRVKIKGKMLSVKAKVMAIGAYSAHADQAGLVDWLQGFADLPHQVYLVHGEEKEASALAKLLVSKDYNVTIPKMNQKVTI